MTMKRAYLDWNATAPVRNEAREAFIDALTRFGNPSSVHAEGRAAKALLENSREAVAAFMGAEPDEVVFTSGGFEANNIALASLAASARERSFMAAPVEHGSISGKLDALAEGGFSKIPLLVTPEGFIDPESASGKAGFAVFQAMNQETGALMDLSAFGEKMAASRTPWHCDAVQLWGRLPFKVRDHGFATASLTGHKLGAPKGTGAFYVKRGTPVTPLLQSGPQEKARRPGTENTPGAAALAAAVIAAEADVERYSSTARALREKLIRGIMELFPKAVVQGPIDPARQVPNTLCVSFPGLSGALLVPALDLEGVAVSSGSACASGATKPSPVLKAMGVSDETAVGTIRISMGWATGDDDAALFLAALGTVLKRTARP